MNWLEPAGLGVEIAEVAVHEADEPDTVGGLFDADQLTGKHGAQVDFAAFVTESTTVVDLRSEVMKRIL